MASANSASSDGWLCMAISEKACVLGAFGSNSDIASVARYAAGIAEASNLLGQVGPWDVVASVAFRQVNSIQTGGYW
jgi:hypothetical protein